MIGNVTIELSLLELTEVNSFQQRCEAVSPLKVKQAKNKFTNSNYILQCTRNKGRFVVPLMMVSEYKGFQALATTIIHSTPEFNAPIEILQQ